METYQVGLIALAISAVAGWLVFFSWRRKIERQEANLASPIFLVAAETGIDCFYVATVFKDRPLDRVVAHGLAHRGFAKAAIEPEGIAICRKGENSFLIPQSDVLAHGRATAVIDKAVEKDGMVVIDWRLGESNLSTHLRFISAQNREQFTYELSEKFGAIK